MKKPKILMTFATLLVATCFQNIALAEETASATVDLTIMQIPEVKGSVMLSVYDNAASFESYTGEMLRAAQKVSASTEQMTITLPKAGNYAIVYFIDENENGTIDMDANGMPLEPVGFSGAGIQNGPPTFDSCAIELSDEAAVTMITIDMPMQQ